MTSSGRYTGRWGSAGFGFGACVCCVCCEAPSRCSRSCHFCCKGSLRTVPLATLLRDGAPLSRTMTNGRGLTGAGLGGGGLDIGQNQLALASECPTRYSRTQLRTPFHARRCRLARGQTGFAAAGERADGHSLRPRARSRCFGRRVSPRCSPPSTAPPRGARVFECALREFPIPGAGYSCIELYVLLGCSIFCKHMKGKNKTSNVKIKLRFTKTRFLTPGGSGARPAAALAAATPRSQTTSPVLLARSLPRAIACKCQMLRPPQRSDRAR